MLTGGQSQQQLPEETPAGPSTQPPVNGERTTAMQNQGPSDPATRPSTIVVRAQARSYPEQVAALKRRVRTDDLRIKSIRKAGAQAMP